MKCMMVALWPRGTTSVAFKLFCCKTCVNVWENVRVCLASQPKSVWPGIKMIYVTNALLLSERVRSRTLFELPLIFLLCFLQASWIHTWSASWVQETNGRQGRSRSRSRRRARRRLWRLWWVWRRELWGEFRSFSNTVHFSILLKVFVIVVTLANQWNSRAEAKALISWKVGWA